MKFVIKKRSKETDRLIEEARKAIKETEDAILKAYDYAIHVDHLSPEEAMEFLYTYMKMDPEDILEIIQRHRGGRQ